MTARRDDLFHRHGFTWQRRWVGDNSGLYVWRTTDGRMEAWRAGFSRDDRGQVVAEYRATRDGELIGVASALRDVMDRAVIAAGQQRRAA